VYIQVTDDGLLARGDYKYTTIKRAVLEILCNTNKQLDMFDLTNLIQKRDGFRFIQAKDIARALVDLQREQYITIEQLVQ
jgi:hypothetical protein